MIRPELISGIEAKDLGLPIAEMQTAFPLDVYPEFELKGFAETGHHHFPSVLFGIRRGNEIRRYPRPEISIGYEILPKSAQLNLEIYFDNFGNPIAAPRAFTLIIENSRRRILHKLRNAPKGTRMGYHSPEISALSIALPDTRYTFEPRPEEPGLQTFALTRATLDSPPQSNLLLTFKEVDSDGFELLPNSWTVLEDNLFT